METERNILSNQLINFPLVLGFFKLFKFGSGGKVRSLQSLVLTAHWSKPSCFGRWQLALAGIAQPNKSVKGTRRPVAVLKFCFYQGLVALFKFSERRAPYRNVRRSEVTGLISDGVYPL